MTYLIKSIILILFAAIFYALGSALYYLMIKDTGTRVVKALTWRIGLSMLLFVLLLLGFLFGIITPHSIT